MPRPDEAPRCPICGTPEGEFHRDAATCRIQLFNAAQQGHPIAPLPPLVTRMTANTFWQARRTEGWVYVTHPARQHLCVSSLADLTYELAKEQGRPDDIDWGTTPARYPLDLLQDAWDDLCRRKVVQLFKDLDEATLAKLHPS